MIELFTYAFFLGVVFNALPGAILAESLRRGLAGGFGPAFAVQIGSLAGDGVWVVLGLLGTAAFFKLSYVASPLTFCGALLLGYLAFSSFQDSNREMPDVRSEPIGKLDKGAMASGIALSLSNPLNITYWVALGGTIAAFSDGKPTRIDFFVFILGFMLSSVLWCFFAAAIIAYTRLHLTQKLWQTLNIVCGIGLLMFAVLVLVKLFEMIWPIIVLLK